MSSSSSGFVITSYSIHYTKLYDIQNVEDELSVGDIVEVKLIDIDDKTGKLKLSRKVLMPRPEKIDK